MKKEISRDLLKKFLRGETTSEESAAVDEWYASLQENPDDIGLLDPLESDFVQNRILDRIKANIGGPGGRKILRHDIKPFHLKSPFKLAAAISALVVIGLGAILFNQKGLHSEDLVTVINMGGIKKFTNNSKTISQIILEDGTKIQLKPKSSIEYPDKFSGSERTVKMIGEAFFDVTKDKKRPFIISAADVTIKVLGTSFNVMAYEGAKQISVAVRTGRVSVSKKAGSSKAVTPVSEEVILTPNQEVVYNTSQEYFAQKLVAKPEIIAEKPTLFETEYDGVPVVKIFSALEQNYGIDIEYDEETLSSCLLTTSMAEEGLYERVQIICKAIGAQYEIQDTQIVIKSKGCL